MARLHLAIAKPTAQGDRQFAATILDHVEGLGGCRNQGHKFTEGPPSTARQRLLGDIYNNRIHEDLDRRKVTVFKEDTGGTSTT